MAEITIQDIPLALRDTIHIDLSRQAGYDKRENWVITTRGMGKSTVAWDMVYNQMKKFDRTSIIVKNQTVDITEAFLSDIENTLNLFRKPSQYGKVSHKGRPEQGVVDVYWTENNTKKWLCRVVALSIKVTRFKSLTIPKPGIFLVDEALPNLKIGEKWLNKYNWRINELYSTFSRYAWLTEKRVLKMWFFANPYSRFIPRLFEEYHLDTMSLRPGDFLVKDCYTINLATPSPELKEWLEKANPSLLNAINKEWQDFMNGEFVNDNNYNLEPKQPNKFTLRWVLKFMDTYIGVFKEHIDSDGPGVYRADLPYWICTLENYDSKKKNVLCFDLTDLDKRSTLAMKEDKLIVETIKYAVAKQLVSYKDVNAASLMEQIFLNMSTN